MVKTLGSGGQECVQNAGFCHSELIWIRKPADDFAENSSEVFISAV